MLTNKQKKQLRAEANSLSSIIQVGKDGLSFNLIETVDHALEAHELIKISVLKSAPLDVSGCAVEIASQTHAEIVQCIGRVLILYRKKRKK